MNIEESKYNKFALVREMIEVSDLIRQFNESDAHQFGMKVRSKDGLFLTGEGSSRIFPAKRMIFDLLRRGLDYNIFTDGSTQAMEYNLKNSAVIGASNSGQTKELIRLFEKLRSEGHNDCYGLTANISTRLELIANNTHVLNCGKEDAVAATKSVFEQALFYDALLHYLAGEKNDRS